MDHLWSPWRYNYVSSSDSVPADQKSCLFCRVGGPSNDGKNHDRENLVVLRGRYSFVLLNRYPYSSGHLMIAPYAHAATLAETDTATLEEVMRLAQRAEKALRAVYKPGGLNLGFNIGQCAGAGIAGHIHMHALPRWAGDTSFITTVGETRVMPEALETTYERLLKAFTEI